MPKRVIKYRQILKELIFQTYFLLKCVLLWPFISLIQLFDKLRYRAKDVWIVGENSGHILYDNSYVFFKYLKEEKKLDKVYFVILSGEKEGLEKQLLEFAVNFGSFKHCFVFLTSKYLVYSHSCADVGYRIAMKIFKRKAVKVFVQHGVIGLKRVDHIYSGLRNDIDVFVTSSNIEQKIISDNFNISKHVVKITGLPRYDNLEIERKTEGHVNVLFFPTWRGPEFPTEVRFEYYRKILNLLDDYRLNEIANQYNLIINYFLHSASVFNHVNFNNNRIRLLDRNDTALSKLIVNSSFLITDYSSVAWDFLYQEKPVILYMFDKCKFDKYVGSYLNSSVGEYFEICYSVDKLLILMESIVCNYNYYSAICKEKKKRYFTYTDNGNCGRVYDQIVNSVTCGLASE